MARAGVCSTTIVLLVLLAVAFTASGALDALTAAAQATDRAAGAKGTSDLLPAHDHRNGGDEETAVDRITDLAGGRRNGASGDVAAAHAASTEEDGKTAASGRGKAKKLDDDDNDDDGDDKGDSDHDHDSDHDSDCDHDHDHDSDSDSDHDDDDDGDSKHGMKKKHASHGRKANPGGKHHDELHNVALEIKP